MNELIILLIVCLLVSLVDYIGFNYVTKTLLKDEFYWHVFQIPGIWITGFALMYFLNIETGVCFLFMHWCFVNDWIYYFYAWLINPANGWENRESAKYYFTTSDVDHAKWTPVGFADYIAGNDETPAIALWVQAGISILATIFLKAF